MDIRNVGNKNSVDRPADRSKRTESARGDAAPAVRRDEASISSASRETAAAVEGLAERARRGDGDRETMVTAAMRKLIAGELDSPEVLQGTARRLLDSKFSTL